MENQEKSENEERQEPAQPPTQPPPEITEIYGTLQKIRYYKNNFLIAVVKLDPVGDGFFSEISVKGTMICAQVGMIYCLHGKIVSEKIYGNTFVFSNYETIFPTEARAVQLYLIENCKSVGVKTAKALTDTFGKRVLEVCKHDPETVAEEIKGITSEKAKKIQESLLAIENQETVMIEIKRMFDGSRVSQKVINQIFLSYGEKAIDKIYENPFALTGFSGIGFVKVDFVARNIGFANDSPFRVRAGVEHVLHGAASGKGHTCFPCDQLSLSAQSLLNVEEKLVDRVISRMIEVGDLSTDEGGNATIIALRSLNATEVSVAGYISMMLARTPDTPPKKEFDTSDLADDQKKALSAMICHNIFILTGAPGTGKTYTVRKMISAFYGKQIALAAPTGKAAARMRELTGHNASTIHRLLGAQVTAGEFHFNYCAMNPLPHEIIIVDEASMIDVNLFVSLVCAIHEKSRLILVGDIYQLPSVGPGAVLRDLIAAGVPTVELTTIKRQDPGKIITNCHKIKAGNPDITWDTTTKGDFFFAEIDNPDKIRDEIVLLLASDRLESNFAVDVVRDVQVLSPLREKTNLSCDSLNELLQGKLNLENNPDDEKQRFWIGDKVIQTKNDYENGIINGDIGYVKKFDNRNIWVTFENPYREVALPLKTNDLGLAYALTVHKYQGSEAPVIIIPVHKCFGPVILQRNWIYTAISRAQRACILIGQIEEVKKTIMRNQQIRRMTQLEKLLGQISQKKNLQGEQE